MILQLFVCSISANRENASLTFSGKLYYYFKMTTDTVFGIVSILVVRTTKVGYGWKANESLFPSMLRYVTYITYWVFSRMTKSAESALSAFWEIVMFTLI